MLSGFSSFLYIFSATFGVTVLLVALTASRASASNMGVVVIIVYTVGLLSLIVCLVIPNIYKIIFN